MYLLNKAVLPTCVSYMTKYLLYLCREINEEDIITPEQGRAVAKEIGALYYETSVLIPFGVDDVFTNVTRAALTGKRDRNFWNILGNLKRISRPMCQAPLEPPKATMPKVVVPPSKSKEDMDALLHNQTFCDVTFIAQGVCIPAHKVCLLAASTVFEELFLSDLASPTEGNNSPPPQPPRPKLMRTNSKCGSCVPQCRPNGTHKQAQSDTITLLDNEEVDMSNAQPQVAAPDANGCLPRHVLNHPAFR